MRSKKPDNQNPLYNNQTDFMILPTYKINIGKAERVINQSDWSEEPDPKAWIFKESYGDHKQFRRYPQSKPIQITSRWLQLCFKPWFEDWKWFIKIVIAILSLLSLIIKIVI